MITRAPATLNKTQKDIELKQRQSEPREAHRGHPHLQQHPQPRRPRRAPRQHLRSGPQAALPVRPQRLRLPVPLLLHQHLQVLRRRQSRRQQQPWPRPRPRPWAQFPSWCQRTCHTVSMVSPETQSKSCPEIRDRFSYISTYAVPLPTAVVAVVAPPAGAAPYAVMAWSSAVLI